MNQLPFSARFGKIGWLVVLLVGFVGWNQCEGKTLPAALSPAALPTHPGFRVFNERDGLPQNSITALALDQRRYLWVGTQDGPAYFNGRRWIPVKLPQKNGSTIVRALAATSDGSLWFGTNDGLFRLYQGSWDLYDTSRGLAHNGVRCLLETHTPEGTICLWVGTRKGLSQITCSTTEQAPVKIQSFGNRQGLPEDVVYSLLQVDRGELLVGTQTGIYRLQNGAFSDFSQLTALDKGTVWALSQTSSPAGGNRFWAGMDGGLFVFENNRWQRVLNDAVVTLAETVSADRKSTLWCGTEEKGVVAITGLETAYYSVKSGLPNNTIRSLLAVSHQGVTRSLWIGTLFGLVRCEAGLWQVVDESTGLPNFGVDSILVTAAGTPAETLWVGTHGGGILRWSQGKWDKTDRTSGLPDNVVYCMQEVRLPNGKSVVWVGTDNGLAVWEDSRWRVLTTKEGLPSKSVVALLSSSNQKGEPVLWVGTQAGLACLENGKFSVYSKDQGLPGNIIMALAETTAPDGTKTLWVGTLDGGLGRLHQGTWTTFATASGLPHELVFSILETVSPTGEHWLWVGTMNGLAFARLDTLQAGTPNSWKVLNDSTAPALPNNVVYQVVEDKQHRLYLYTNRGIARLTQPPPDSAIQPEFQLVTCTTEDGLASNECNSGSAFRDALGRLWAGTGGAVNMLNPQAEVEDYRSKPLYFERIYLNGQPLEISGVPPVRQGGAPVGQGLAGATLNHNENNLVFEYGLISWFHEGQTLYQTHLVGFEPRPSEWSPDYKKEYTNLPGGTYSFVVRARDYAGHVSEPVTVSFHIRLAPWRTWWALAGYALVLVGSGALLFAWRERAQKIRQEQKLTYLSNLLKSTQVINTNLALELVLQDIAQEGAALVSGEPGGIGLVEGDNVVFRRVWNKGRWEEHLVEIPLGEGVAGQVAATAQSLIVNDAAAYGKLFNPDLASRYLQVRGMVDVPIIDGNGTVVGVLDVRRPAQRAPFTRNDQILLESLGHQAAVAIEKASLYGRLEAQNSLIVKSNHELEDLLKREQEVTRKLKELNQMKVNFMLVASHEMRTPLTVMKGYNEALLSGHLGPLQPAQEKSLTTNQRMISRLSLMVQDIFELVKIDDGKISLSLSVCDLSVLMREVTLELEDFIQKRKQTITLVVAEPLRLEADEKKLKVILTSLIQNAIKFSFDEGTIRLSAQIQGEVVQIQVEDHGIGIAAEQMDHIFEKFYTDSDVQTHSSGRFEFMARGAGLGLAITKSFVEAHGGRIWAESAGKGTGSRFTVVLPLKNGPENPA